MIKYMIGDEQAGLYNVVFIAITTILISPTVLYSKFLIPKYYRWANHDKEKFYDARKKGNIIMLISGGIMMIIVSILSGFFIPIIFGKEYVDSIKLLNTLSLALPVIFVAYSVESTLVTNEHMKLKVKLMGFTALINILLNILLIPKYVGEGAAVATLISNILLLALYYKNAQNKVFDIKRKKICN